MTTEQEATIDRYRSHFRLIGPVVSAEPCVWLNYLASDNAEREVVVRLRIDPDGSAVQVGRNETQDLAS